MKQLILIALLLFSAATYAQTVNGKPLKEVDVEYVQIVGTSKFMSLTKVTIEIDFGQENKYWSQKDTQIRGEDGKLMTFNSMIDALNFMTANGYEFVQAYAFATGNQNVYHYLLRRKK